MSNFISLEKAIGMTKQYRENKEAIIAPGYSSADILPICDTFDKSSIEALVNKPECVYIRLYYGMNKDLTIRPIVVAVNAKNEDILPSGALTLDEDIVNDTIKCPPICPPPSPLNE